MEKDRQTRIVRRSVSCCVYVIQRVLDHLKLTFNSYFLRHWRSWRKVSFKLSKLSTSFFISIFLSLWDVSYVGDSTAEHADTAETGWHA